MNKLKMCTLCGCETDERTSQNWIVPRYVICMFFWSGLILAFLGGMVIVNAYLAPESQIQGLTAGGGVLLGIGVILLVICLILAFHAYYVILHRPSEAPQYNVKDNRNGITIIHHPEKQLYREINEEYRRPSGTVTFNAVDSVMKVDNNNMNNLQESFNSRKQQAELLETSDEEYPSPVSHKPPPFPRTDSRGGNFGAPQRPPARSVRKPRPASQPLSPDEIDLPTYDDVTIADSKVSLYDNVQYQWPKKSQTSA